VETVFIETTIVSYLVANRSRDRILAAHQELTREWWLKERQRYNCVTSEEVLREASLGDATMGRRRMDALAGIPVLLVEDAARELARSLLAEKILPPAAASDAIHVAVSSLNGVNFLLTWNCRHLANPHLLGRLREFMARHGLSLPEICTPVELVGD
jgi:hypothetical protein